MKCPICGEEIKQIKILKVYDFYLDKEMIFDDSFLDLPHQIQVNLVCKENHQEKLMGTDHLLIVPMESLSIKILKSIPEKLLTSKAKSKIMQDENRKYYDSLRDPRPPSYD